MNLVQWKRRIASIALISVPVGIWLGVQYFESGYINEIILLAFSPILISVGIEFWALWRPSDAEVETDEQDAADQSKKN